MPVPTGFAYGVGVHNGFVKMKEMLSVGLFTLFGESVGSCVGGIILFLDKMV